MPDGTERPIAYTSRTLLPAERNYSQIEWECLAMVYSVKKLHQYLFGRSFTMTTDHKPLLGLLGEEKLVPIMSAARIQHWALPLSMYNYELRYRSSPENANADCMSHLPQPSDETSNSKNQISLCELSHSPVTSKEVKLYTKRDSILSHVYDFVLQGWPQEVKDESFKPYTCHRQELSVEEGCILWGNQVIIPPPLQKRVLEELHEAHPGMSRMSMVANHE